MRILCGLLIIAVSLCCVTLAQAASPTLVVTPATWTSPAVDATWLTGGTVGSVAGNAGSNLLNPYQTPSNVVTLAINPRGNAGTCKVYRTDTSWWTGGTIKVQCATMSTGWVTVGTAASPATLFNYPTGGAVVNYLCQIELDGAAYNVAAAAYKTTLTFTVQ